MISFEQAALKSPVNSALDGMFRAFNNSTYSLSSAIEYEA